MADTLNYDDRKIISTISTTYYDTTYFENNMQNNIIHNREIPKINRYKSFNIQLADSEDIIVKDINFLYFTSQRPVSLTLSTSGSISLNTSEFYLYQPNDTFSFKITSFASEDSCTCFIHCMYASLFK